MKIYFVSIFPDIFNSFVETSLIKKAVDKKVLEFEFVDPRDFCLDKHRQVDDEIYGGGAGLLMKVEPVVEAVESLLPPAPSKIEGESWKVVFVSPSEKVFDQRVAHELAEVENLIFVAGRYEGVDHRFVEYMQKNYPDNFEIVSLGKFVTLGGELPAMVMTEAIVRLVPGVIKEEDSRKDESYSVDKEMNNLEYPQYTRPEEFCGMKVPEVLLSGNHKKIEEWRDGNERRI